MSIDVYCILVLNSLQHGVDNDETRCTTNTATRKKRGFVNDKNLILGSKGGAVVRALASHQCGPGSTPGVDAICGLSLLLVLSLAPRGFSPGTLVFPSSGNDNKIECLEYLVLIGRSKRYEQNINPQEGGGGGYST